MPVILRAYSNKSHKSWSQLNWSEKQMWKLYMYTSTYTPALHGRVHNKFKKTVNPRSLCLVGGVELGWTARSCDWYCGSHMPNSQHCKAKKQEVEFIAHHVLLVPAHLLFLLPLLGLNLCQPSCPLLLRCLQSLKQFLLFPTTNQPVKQVNVAIASTLLGRGYREPTFVPPSLSLFPFLSHVPSPSPSSSSPPSSFPCCEIGNETCHESGNGTWTYCDGDTVWGETRF